MTPPDSIARYVRDRRALIEAAEPGEPAARDLSDLTDDAVSRLAASTLSRLPGPWAVLALGGWGARRLLPGSDLDLLVVTDTPAARLRPALEEMLYPLWDAGLEIGHQVRTRSGHLAAVRADLPALTATLTGRPLAGDRALAEGLLLRCATDARRRRRRILSELASRARPGSPYLLEPDLKEGAGGQRDLDEMTWTAAVQSGAPASGPGPLVALGLLSSDEVARVSAAGRVLTGARWALQIGTGRTRSRLDLESAADAGVDTRALQTALADVHHVLLRMRDRLGARRGVAARRAGDDAGDDAVAGETMFSWLDSGELALPLLEDAAWSGRLDDLIPGMSDLMTLRRPALSHTLTVGAHSLRCAAIVAAVPPRGSDGTCGTEGPRGSEGLRRRRVLQAAALLHDIGKVHAGPGHAGRSASMAATILPRLGLAEDAAADAALLVREHLLLAETAVTQDIHDEDVVVRTAARLPRPEIVDDLYALTAADSLATGPDAWTPWHAALVGELADRLTAVAGHDSWGAAVTARAERTRAAASRLIAGDADPEVAAFVRTAHLRYLARRKPGEVVAHARLAADAMGAGRPRSAVTPGPAPGSWAVTVAAPDHHGLFGSIAGSLALAGLDILSADAHSAPTGVAVDTFLVRPDTLAEAGPATWAAFDRFLAAAAGGRLDLDARLEQRRLQYRQGAARSAVVSIEPTGAYATAVHVTASDRSGLLHDIARGIADCGLEIRWARATTRGGVARDVFHVVDSSDEPVDDPGLLGHLAMRIRERASGGERRPSG